MKRFDMEYNTPKFDILDIFVERGFSVSDGSDREFEDGGDFI